MANASKNHMGPATHGKGSGSGAMTDLPDGVLGENMVLKNRDKSRHGEARGLDGRDVQTEQYQDHSGARRVDPTPDAATASGLAQPQDPPSSDDASGGRDPDARS